MCLPFPSPAPCPASSGVLSDRVSTFGQYLLRRYGERVHKLAIHAGFTCPNRDGTKGRGGCTFCNNASFNPQGQEPPSSSLTIEAQVAAGRAVLVRRTGARRFLAYFQAYTNTYDDLEALRRRYDRALACPGVIGLSVGTRPDCLGDGVLDLLAAYRARGLEVWLELGLQSAHDAALGRVNRGHGFAEYRQAVQAAHRRGLPVCTHLILGLPGEDRVAAMDSLEQVLALGVEGLKLHPLHVVRHTRLALDWRRGDYQPWEMQDYIGACADLIERTPPSVLYHRVTGTASPQVLLAPQWCSKKWTVLNGIEAELRRRGSRQGCRAPVAAPQALSA